MDDWGAEQKARGDVMQNRIEKKEKSHNYQPSRELELFCYALISEQVKGNKARAQELTRVDKGKFYYAWRHHAEFRAWYTKLCFDILTHNAAIPAYALLSAIVGKDVQAIRTYYELTGQLKHIVKTEGEAPEVKVPTAVYFISGRVENKVENAGTAEHGAGGQLPTGPGEKGKA